jgi:hypothetical protein
MTRVEKIETEIQSLSSEEIATLRRWFMEFDAAAWDQQIESDIHASRLDQLADQALADHRAGRSREL